MNQPELYRALLLRILLATAAGLLAFVLYAASLYLHKTLRITVDISADTPTVATIFYSLGGLPFEEGRAVSRALQPDEQSTVYLRWIGYQRVTAIRIDPLDTAGEATISRVQLKTPHKELVYRGTELTAAITTYHQLETLKADATNVRYRATGTDSQLTLPIPASLYYPSTDELFPHGVWMGLSAALIILLISTYIHRFSRPQRRWLLSVGAVLFLTLQAIPSIDGPIYGDGERNLRIAHNLYTHGIYSSDERMPPRPDNRREPLPILIINAHMHAVASLLPNTDFTTLQSGDGSRLIKLSNLYWIFAGLLGAWILAHQLTGRHAISAITTLITFYFFFGESRWINNLYTELQTGTLLLWVAVAWLGANRKPTLMRFTALGALAALLVLTKSAFLYIFLIAWLLLLLDVALRPFVAGQRKRSIVFMLVTFISAFMVLTPWLVRNYLQVDDTMVSQRGGQILFGRALLNSMSLDERKGVYYLYGPSLYRERVSGTYALQPGDLDRGGRWQRLNRWRSTFAAEDYAAMQAGDPDAALSFHRIASAHVIAARREFEATGHPAPLNAADERLKNRAIAMIKADPVAHLKMIAPTFWRGLWSIPLIETPGLMEHRQVQLVEWTNLLGFMTLIGTALISLIARHRRLIGVTLPALGLLAFYAILTHNIPRYYAPVHPLMLILMITMPAIGLGQVLKNIRGKTPWLSLKRTH